MGRKSRKCDEWWGTLWLFLAAEIKLRLSFPLRDRISPTVTLRMSSSLVFVFPTCLGTGGSVVKMNCLLRNRQETC